MASASLQELEDLERKRKELAAAEARLALKLEQPANPNEARVVDPLIPGVDPQLKGR